ncbi:putative RING-H2 finger protein ATL50 [Lotus japonicus]|uniref:putative RING-H2 finger protein ATL50 n=1 Tax=Lotus japonicus TaxID=34305 RepID=UPI002583353B|nr:putative RING-H2 finger protein ATL50 [Lotus japonicus]
MECWPHMVVLVISSSSMLQYSGVVDAQGAITTNPAPLGITFTTFKDNLKATMSIMLLAFFSVFLIMGFISLYLRHCSYAYGGGARSPITTAADLCSRGINRQLIDKCPVLAVKDLRIGEGGSCIECAVCLAEFQDGDSIRLLPKCHHVFHPDCIDSWLLSHMSCPVCRATLTSDDVPDDIVIIPISDTTTTTTATATEPEPPANGSSSSTISSSVTVTEIEEVVTAPEEEGEGEISNSIVFLARESRMMVRSHSTGHSLVGPEEKVKVWDRYMLRLPEHVRRKRILRENAVFPGEWSAKRAWEGGGGIGNNNVERWWWSLSMTPPLGFRSGGGTSGGDCNGGNFLGACWTPVRVSPIQGS